MAQEIEIKFALKDRDALLQKLYDIGAGTNEIRRYLIGRELIGA